MGYTLASASPPLPRVFGSSVGDCLPLEIGDCIGTAAGEGHDVILPIAGTGTARPIRRRAWMLALKFACHRTRSMLACRCRVQAGHQRDAASQCGKNDRVPVSYRAHRMAIKDDGEHRGDCREAPNKRVVIVWHGNVMPHDG